MRIVVRWSMGLVALAAAALSYQSLVALAELAGYGRLSILYPLVVDAGAAASCAAWLHTRGRQPLIMTWALLLCSVILNGTTHYLESTHTAPSWILVVAVAAVPPTVLGLCVHLAVGLGRPDQLPEPTEELAEPTAPAGFKGANLHTQPSDAQTDDVCRPDQPESGRLVGSTTPRGFMGSAISTSGDGTGNRIDYPIDELIAQGAGRRKIAAALDISEYEARKLISASRNGAGDVPS